MGVFVTWGRVLLTPRNFEATASREGESRENELSRAKVQPLSSLPGRAAA